VAEFRTEGDFEISADALWGAIRDFGNLGWVPGNPDFDSEGDGVGMIRTIRKPPIPTVREQLNAIDEPGRAIHYSVLEGNPMPVRDYRAIMRVIDLGESRSRLEWSSTWEPVDVSEEDARKSVKGIYTVVLASMKRKLEQG
jgi:hypothetical protein